MAQDQKHGVQDDLITHQSMRLVCGWVEDTISIITFAINQMPLWTTGTRTTDMMNGSSIDTETISIAPMVSATYFNEGNFPRAWFDESLAWLIKTFGHERASKNEDRWYHCIGVATELATAAYLDTTTPFEVQFDRTITDDYIGDDGYDLRYNQKKIEVKAVTGSNDTELKISQEQAETSDYIVLTRCSNPFELVQLIGWAPSTYLDAFGYRFRDNDLIRLDAEYLLPFEPVFLSPDRIRESQQL